MRKINLNFLLGGLILATASLGITPLFAYTVETIPNMRLSGGWIADPDNIVPEAEETQINQILSAIETDLTAEVGIVVVNSISEAVPRTFVHELFNLWGVGKKNKDNGLLLLLVIDQKRWEAETGYGLEGVLPDVTLKRLGEKSFPAHFRAGNYGTGLLEFTRALDQMLRNNADEVREPTTTQRPIAVSYFDDVFTEWFYINLQFFIACALLFFGLYAYLSRQKSRSQKEKGDNSLEIKLEDKYYYYSILPVVFGLYIIAPYLTFFNFTLEFIIAFLSVLIPSAGLAYAVLQFLKFRKINNSETVIHPYRKIQILEKMFGKSGSVVKLTVFSLVPLLILFFFSYNLFHSSKSIAIAFVALAAGAIYFWYFIIRSKLRKAPRACVKCSTIVPERLSEKEDDIFLSSGQKTEEQIGSVDYDVWVCPTCSHHEIYTFDAWFTKYDRCPQCSYKTKYMSGSVTLVSPTCTSSGKGRRDYACKHCTYTASETYTIPARNCESSSSSSSSGGYSSGSSGSSGSWGGGSSGGGGAGGSW